MSVFSIRYVEEMRSYRVPPVRLEELEDDGE
jgi:hypothetical protein